MIEAGRQTSSGEDVAGKFEAAWNVFAQTCSRFLAPEATYQAWFAHYLISQFGIDRVAREPIIKHRHFTSQWRSHFDRGGEVRLDAVITRNPGVYLPHYANKIAGAGAGNGLDALTGLAVICELKVSATQQGGLDHTEVARDVWKLSMLLDEFTQSFPKAPKPLAYVCVLDNHPTRRYNFDHLRRRLDRLPGHADVRPLHVTAEARPAMGFPLESLGEVTS